MRIVFIDDDAENRAQWLDLASGYQVEAFAFEGTLDAIDMAADLFVIDISACGSLFDTRHAYSPICGLALERPGSVFVIFSGMARHYIDDVVRDVQERVPSILIVGINGATATIDSISGAVRKFGIEIKREGAGG